MFVRLGYVTTATCRQLDFRAANQVSTHVGGGSSTFFNGTINKAAPARRPVGASKEDVALAGSELFEVRRQQTRSRKEPAINQSVPCVQVLQI